MRRDHARGRVRSRWVSGGRWRVHARVERFAEPALLLLLAEQPAHGYELLERLPALTGGDSVEMGNLYRVLRALEEEGLVRSEWQSDAPGPARRSYELTETGSRLLGTWADALRDTHRVIGAFLERYERGKEVN